MCALYNVHMRYKKKHGGKVMKKKKILMLACMAVLAATVAVPVHAAKKTNKKRIQVLNLYQDSKTDIEEPEYLVSYLEGKNIDEESAKKKEKQKWYINIKTGKITKIRNTSDIFIMMAG